MDIISFFNSIIFLYGKFYLYLAAGLQSYGLAIVMLSILTSILMLRPIRWANKVTKREQEFQNVLMPQLEAIKKQATGAQQYAHISALYQRYSYHPIFAVRRVTPLFIQLPFFILAYLMLDGLTALNGQSFLFLSNLGTPDELLHGGNLLPFVMTGVNLAAALFVPNFSRKDLYQAAAVSLLFFILLYHHASALLLYWTMNNMIILFRNIMAYRKADKNQRIDFKVLWRKFILLMMGHEVLLFLIIFLLYILISRSLFFTAGYNLTLTRAIRTTLIWGIAFLAFVHLLFYTKAIWEKPYHYIKGNLKKGYLNIKSIQLKLYRINDKKRPPLPRVSLADCVLMLIPLAPIIQYVLLNQNLMPFGDRIIFIGASAALIFSIVIAIPFVLQKYLPIYGLVPLGITLSYVYLSMPAFSLMFRWASRPDLPLLTAILAILFSALLLLYVKQRKLLRYMAVIFFMVSMMYTLYVIYILQEAEEASAYSQVSGPQHDFSNFIPTGSMKQKPDIYLLTYDAYVGQETMQQYGVDNSAQEEFLINDGFKIYKGTYTIAPSSIGAMSRVLDIVGGDSYIGQGAREATAGNALVVNVLKEQGYTTYGVLSPYMLINVPVVWEHYFPERNSAVGYKSLLKGLGEGQFRFDIIDEFQGDSRADGIAMKRKVLSAQTPSPKFMYTHSFRPGHHTFIGECLPDRLEIFKQRLQDANEEMKADINTILASKRDAIIIVNGDHGPYLTGDCYRLRGYSIEDISQLELQDRLGTFLAIRWPDESYQQYDDIRILQDTFDAVFKFLFATDRVLKQRPDTTSLDKRGIAEGFVVDGKIMLGKDKGKPLFND